MKNQLKKRTCETVDRWKRVKQRSAENGTGTDRRRQAQETVKQTGVCFLWRGRKSEPLNRHMAMPNRQAQTGKGKKTNPRLEY